MTALPSTEDLARFVFVRADSSRREAEDDHGPGEDQTALLMEPLALRNRERNGSRDDAYQPSGKVNREGQPHDTRRRCERDSIHASGSRA